MTDTIEKNDYEINFEVKVSVVGKYGSDSKLGFSVTERVPKETDPFTHLRKRLREELKRNQDGNYLEGTESDEL